MLPTTRCGLALLAMLYHHHAYFEQATLRCILHAPQANTANLLEEQSGSYLSALCHHKAGDSAVPMKKAANAALAALIACLHFRHIVRWHFKHLTPKHSFCIVPNVSQHAAEN